MTGRDVIGTDFVCVTNQALKFDIRVAENARIRGSSMQILRYEVVDDDLAKIRRYIFINQRNVKLLRDILRGSSASLIFSFDVKIVADDLTALFFQ